MKALFAGALALGLGCSSARPRPPRASRVPCHGSLPADELEVVSAAVEPHARKELTMIAESTHPYSLTSSHAQGIPSGVHERDDTRYDLDQLKVETLCIPLASAPMPLLRDAEVPEGLWPDEYWDWFGKQHPPFQAVAYVSRVGFSSDRMEALVFVQVLCGPFCGEIGLVRLEHREGGWAIAESTVHSHCGLPGTTGCK